MDYITTLRASSKFQAPSSKKISNLKHQNGLEFAYYSEGARRVVSEDLSLANLTISCTSAGISCPGLSSASSRSWAILSCSSRLQNAACPNSTTCNSSFMIFNKRKFPADCPQESHFHSTIKFCQVVLHTRMFQHIAEFFPRDCSQGVATCSRLSPNQQLHRGTPPCG